MDPETVKVIARLEARIVALEKTVARLEEDNARKDEEIARLKEDNARLKQENERKDVELRWARYIRWERERAAMRASTRPCAMS